MTVERGGGHLGGHGRRLGRRRLGRFDPTRLSDPAEQPLNMLFGSNFCLHLRLKLWIAKSQIAALLRD